MTKVRAFAVHILTACGAALALGALIAAARANWSVMFLLLGIALVVDAVDGPIARAVNVKEKLPRWSGDVLDLVVDYTTYVFVPAYAVVASGLMLDKLAIAAGCLIAITGTLYFADREMKTADNFFRGFPAAWNLIVFYLMLLRPSPELTAAVIVLFSVLTFVPLRFVHPFRVRRWRTFTVAALTLWAVLAGAAVKQDLSPEPWIIAALCLVAVYFLVLGLLPASRNPK